MSKTAIPYLESFGCRFETDENDHEHPGDCEWGFSCGTCGRWLDGDPCPDHAPLDVPGLMLTECTTEPPHPRSWVLASDTGYGAPCMYCAYDAMREAHDGCAHSRHWPWRSWRVTHRVLYRLSLLGVAGDRSTTWDAYCKGCADLRWGGNGYVLGWPKWKWSCVLQGRHWPGDLTEIGICGKCSPCPGCNSVTAGHCEHCPVTA